MMRCLFRFELLIAFQFLLLPCGWAAEQEPVIPESEATAAFERGKKLLEVGKVDEAIKDLQRGTRSAEKEVLARANLARAYLAKEGPKKAGAIVDEALRIAGERIRGAVVDDTISAQHYVDRGFAWIVKQEVLQKAWEERVADGTPCMDLDCLEDAIEDLKNAIELDPECFHAHRLLASTYLRTRSFPEAIAACDKALAARPKYLDLYHYRAYACVMCEGRGWRDAVDSCDRALSVEPDSARFLLLRGRGYAAGGQWDEAIADYEQAALLDPRDPDIPMCLSQAHLEQGKVRAALEDVERAVRLKPAAITDSDWLIPFLCSLGDCQSVPRVEIMPILSRICAAAPEHGECHILRSVVNTAYGHKEASSRDWRKAGELGLSRATSRFFQVESPQEETDTSWRQGGVLRPN